MSFFGLFSSARALRVTDAGHTTVYDPRRVHYEHTWTVGAADPDDCHRINKLSLKTPGLTIVRVTPSLGDDIAARITASSDDCRHLDRLSLAIKHKSELHVKLEKTREAPPPRGVLIVEVELVHASLIDELEVSGGGDVVVEDQTLASGDATHVSVVALNQSRVFLRQALMTLKSLRVASVSGGSVFLSTTSPLVAREHVACLLLGDGRIAISAPRVETRELSTVVVGDSGNAQVLAPDGFAITKAETVVFGGGSILVQSSPLHERHAVSITDRLSVEVTGPGSVDVAAIASREATVSAKDGGRAVVQPRERLAMTCEATSTVECIGALPPRVDPAPSHIPPEMLLVLAFENRVWTASEPLPVVPTVDDAWATPRILELLKAGIRETLRPLGAAMQLGNNWRVTNGSNRNAGVQRDASTQRTAPPVWVNVMSDVAGGGKSIN